MINNGIDKWATTEGGKGNLENPVSKHRLQITVLSIQH